METNIIIPINVYNDLPQWQKNELYDAAEWVYHPDYKGVTSVVFYLGESE